MEDLSRRGFLRVLGLGVAAAAAPKVTYSFLGGILRPRKPEFYFNRKTYEMLQAQAIERVINPPMYYCERTMTLRQVAWEYGLGVRVGFIQGRRTS